MVLTLLVTGLGTTSAPWQAEPSPLNSPKTMFTKFCYCSFSTWQQKETYDSKILLLLDKSWWQIKLSVFLLAYPCQKITFSATILILQRWRNYGKQESIWSLCYQVTKEDALGLKLLYPSTASFNFKFKCIFFFFQTNELNLHNFFYTCVDWW